MKEYLYKILVVGDLGVGKVSHSLGVVSSLELDFDYQKICAQHFLNALQINCKMRFVF